MKRTTKQFDAVKFMREQRDALSKLLSEMTADEIVQYFKARHESATTNPKG